MIIGQVGWLATNSADLAAQHGVLARSTAQARSSNGAPEAICPLGVDPRAGRIAMRRTEREPRGSRSVLWEPGGAIPLADPTRLIARLVSRRRLVLVDALVTGSWRLVLGEGARGKRQG